MISSDPRTRPATPVRPLDWARQAGKVDAVMLNLAAKLRQRRRRRVKAATAVASLGLTVGFLFWAVPFTRDTATVVTAPAHRQMLALADGSTAELNARTEIRTDFRHGRRKIYLRSGEAFFAVRKDAAQPFTVETAAGTVRVTGTQFNVRLVDDRAVVTLVEGSVEFGRDASPRVALRPGEQFATATATAPARPRALTSAEMEAALSWRRGHLSLDGLTLGEAAARIAAYHGKTIAVAPAIVALPLGGSCPLDDLAGFLAFLKDAFPVEIVARGDGSVGVVARR